jgi:hypothetical protein
LARYRWYAGTILENAGRRRRTRRIPSLMMQYRMAAVAQLEGSHVNNIIMGSGGRHVFMMCWVLGVWSIGCAWAVVRRKFLYVLHTPTSYYILYRTYLLIVERPHHGVKAGERQTREARYNTTILICIMYKSKTSLGIAV